MRAPLRLRDPVFSLNPFPASSKEHFRARRRGGLLPLGALFCPACSLSRLMAARSWSCGLRGVLRAGPVPCRPRCLAFSGRPWGEPGAWQRLRRRLLGPCEPPFQRVCLVGDPALRGVAAPVEPERVSSAEVQRLIARLVAVMRREGCVGLSAPQLGVPLQVFVAEFRGPPLPEELPEGLRALEVAPFTLRVFVNPAVRVLDSRTSHFTEGCASLPGFSAVVARHMGVEVSGLNEAGEQTAWQARGFAARIVQHEMDHLKGILYVDKMESGSFTCLHWAKVNR